jgi:hypothetical protein
MLRPLAFSPATEEAVRFVEHTDPGRIVEATVERLRGGATAAELLRAAALAVTRSTELPPDHHGGPVHPVSGIHSAFGLSQRLEGEWSYVPVIQSVVLANRHIHSPEMGPALMGAQAADAAIAADPEGARAHLHKLILDRRPATAERYMLGLLEAGRVADVLSPLLAVAIPRNSLDDHYLLYLIHTLRGLDDIGWESAGTLLRGPLRYLATNPLMDEVGEFDAKYMSEAVNEYRSFPWTESLLERYRLVDAKTRLGSSASETPTIREVGERLGGLANHRDVAEGLAGAIADGLSVEGASEALSYAAGRLYLRTRTGNPFDVHMHTGLNPRRHLLRRFELPLRVQLLLLLSWPLGPEVRYLLGRLRPQVELDDRAAPADAGPRELLDAIERSIRSQPGVDLDRLEVRIDFLLAAPSVDETMNLAYAYCRRGFDPEPIFKLFARLVSEEDVTEMHAFKLQESAREEYYTTREELRFVHLVSAARHLATVYNLKPKTTFPRIAGELRLG